MEHFSILLILEEIIYFYPTIIDTTEIIFKLIKFKYKNIGVIVE